MKSLYAVNVNHAYRAGLRHLQANGRKDSSRYGDVIVCDEPVTTTYVLPQQRVLWDAQRDVNPFFHVIEGLWMLAGLRDVATMEWLLPRMASFSDDGRIFHGAYGHRWRHWPTRDGEIDQLKTCINLLFQNPKDRRVVMAMWNPELDLGRDGKDFPCNDMIKFRVIDDLLHMYVFNRSNDAIWGAYGANAVHMSMLQEYVAQMCELGIGRYEQISTDFHAYVNVWDKCWPLRDEAVVDLYNPAGGQAALVSICPLVSYRSQFDNELRVFFNYWGTWKHEQTPNDTTYLWRNPFFPSIAIPMLQAYTLHKEQKATLEAAQFLEHQMAATENFDWLVAGHAWLMRRYHAKKKGAA